MGERYVDVANLKLVALEKIALHSYMYEVFTSIMGNSGLIYKIISYD